jgi:hypothetical protein
LTLLIKEIAFSENAGYRLTTSNVVVYTFSILKNQLIII